MWGGPTVETSTGCSVWRNRSIASEVVPCSRHAIQFEGAVVTFQMTEVPHDISGGIAMFLT